MNGPMHFLQFLDYDQATGGYRYNMTLCDELERLGHAIHRVALPNGFPTLSSDSVAECARILDCVPSGGLVLIDQVCLSRIWNLAARHLQRVRWVNIFHHSMDLDLPPGSEEANTADAKERDALAISDAIIVTSSWTEQILLSRYNIGSEKIIVGSPGFSWAEHQPKIYDSSRPVKLISVGAVVLRKNYLGLIDALIRIKSLPWSMTVIGSLHRDFNYVEAVRRAIHTQQLDHKISLIGNVDDDCLDLLFNDSDLYVGASEYEGFGMAVAEALQHGLPIVTTNAGALRQWQNSKAVLCSEVGDMEDLAVNLKLLINDTQARTAMSIAAIQAAQALPRWSCTAACVAKRLSEMFGIDYA